MYKSLVFGDEFLAQGLHLKSQQRSSAGIRTWLYAKKSYVMAYFMLCYGFMQTRTNKKRGKKTFWVTLNIVEAHSK